MIEIVISRVEGASKFRQVATFEGRVLGNGRTPFFEACRALIAEGKNPDEYVTMRWDGKETVSFAGRLKTFADRTVHESDKTGPKIAKFVPYPTDKPRYPYSD